MQLLQSNVTGNIYFFFRVLAYVLNVLTSRYYFPYFGPLAGTE